MNARKSWIALALSLVLGWSTLCQGALAIKAHPEVTSSQDADGLKEASEIMQRTAGMELPMADTSDGWLTFPTIVPEKTSVGVGQQRANTTTIIEINNEGVEELKKAYSKSRVEVTRHYEQAIADFEECLRLDPNYFMARDNLAITHNNYALSLRKTPTKALTQIRQALLLNPHNPVTASNFEGLYKLIGHDPNDAAAHSDLAQQALNDGDLVGFSIEIFVCGWLKEHPNHDWKESLRERQSEIAPNPQIYVSYIEILLRRHWSHPPTRGYARERVSFAIDENGALLWDSIKLSEGDPSGKQTALDAVRKAAPFPILDRASTMDNLGEKQITLQFDFMSDHDKFTCSGHRVLGSKVGPLMEIRSSSIVDHTPTLDISSIGSSLDPDADVNCTQVRVQKMWNHSLHPYGAPIVSFGIKRDGSLVNLRLEKSSGSVAGDNFALDAIRKCAPFAWPSDQSVTPIRLELNFVADSRQNVVSARRTN